MPLISIITITYNAEAFLERTINSIKKQPSNEFEYILIDGKSSDKTMDIVEQNKGIFSVIISEKDNGLYDAMNKGLELAKGKYVWFMNAGDEIAEENAIEKINLLYLQNADVIYSDTIVVDSKSKYIGLRTEVTKHKLPKILTWKMYNKGMLVCHQSFVVKKSIAPFYISKNLSADIDWCIQCLKKSKKTMFYDGILSKYLEGGVSQQLLFKGWKDRYMVLQKHFGFLPNFFNHILIVFRADVLNLFRTSKYIKKK